MVGNLRADSPTTEYQPPQRESRRAPLGEWSVVSGTLYTVDHDNGRGHWNANCTADIPTRSGSIRSGRARPSRTNYTSRPSSATWAVSSPGRCRPVINFTRRNGSRALIVTFVKTGKVSRAIGRMPGFSANRIRPELRRGRFTLNACEIQKTGDCIGGNDGKNVARPHLGPPVSSSSLGIYENSPPR